MDKKFHSVDLKFTDSYGFESIYLIALSHEAGK